MPNTEQGLREYILYAIKEQKVMERRNKKLREDIIYCKNQLSLKGYDPEKGEFDGSFNTGGN